MVKEIEISIEAYRFLEQARLPNEDFSDTLLCLVSRYKQIEFIRSQKQILEDEVFLPLDDSKE